jgi:hypothetical protein
MVCIEFPEIQEGVEKLNESLEILLKISSLGFKTSCYCSFSKPSIEKYTCEDWMV